MWIKHCSKAFNNWRENTKEEEEYRDVFKLNFVGFAAKLY